MDPQIQFMGVLIPRKKSSQREGKAARQMASTYFLSNNRVRTLESTLCNRVKVGTFRIGKKMRTLMSLFWRGNLLYYFHIFYHSTLERVHCLRCWLAPRWKIGWPPHQDMCPCFHDKSQKAAVTSRRIDRERDCVAPRRAALSPERRRTRA